MFVLPRVSNDAGWHPWLGVALAVWSDRFLVVESFVEEEGHRSFPEMLASEAATSPPQRPRVRVRVWVLFVGAMEVAMGRH